MSNSTVPNFLVFFCGILMLAIFIAYIASTEPKRKRIIGTGLAAFMAVFFGLGFAKLGVNLGQDLKGGSSFRCKINPGKTDEGKPKPVTPQSFDVARTILSKRLNPEGNRDLRVVPFTERNELEVQMPGVGQEEINWVKETIEKVARLEFRMVKPDQSNLAAVMAGDIDPGWVIRNEHRTDSDGIVIDAQGRPVYDEDGVIISDFYDDEGNVITDLEQVSHYYDEEGRYYNKEGSVITAPEDVGDSEPKVTLVPRKPDEIPLLVNARIDLSGEMVDEARAAYVQQGWIVMLDFDKEGGKIFGDLTTRHVNDRFAIIVDDVIISAPNINEPITQGSCTISGQNWKEREVRELASNLNNPLQNPLVIIDERTTSATFGEGVQKQGMMAGIVGLSLTMLFILIYYRAAGIIALVGLAMNVVLLAGAMALFGFTLTMPGIAGLILTIGIAVDANVLIYERLREEMQTGKSLRAAIDSAYDKAFSAIFDANITTLITGLILFLVASDLIKGFAITLVVGIFSSMVAALILTRVLFSWLTKSGLQKLSFLNLVPERSLDILSKTKFSIVCSALLLALFFAMAFVKGKSGIGPDFKGGDQVEFALTGNASDTGITEVAALFEGMDYTHQKEAVDGKIEQVTEPLPKPFVQEQGNASGDRFIVVQSEPGSADEVATALTAAYPDLQSETASVGPTVGRSLALTSLGALVLGLAAIMVYITLRFEFSFALGALVALVHDLLIVTGFILLSGTQLTLLHVGALLTIAGYSINDTIVVFDRIREELRSRSGNIKDIMNFAISQTLSRTVLTSLTTLVMVLTLWIFGGPSLKEFAFAIIIGVLVGTYSSLFVASPIVLWWSRMRNKNLRSEVLESDQESVLDPTVA